LIVRGIQLSDSTWQASAAVCRHYFVANDLPPRPASRNQRKYRPLIARPINFPRRLPLVILNIPGKSYWAMIARQE
jgi:hypothetical protein